MAKAKAATTSAAPKAQTASPAAPIAKAKAAPITAAPLAAPLARSQVVQSGQGGQGGHSGLSGRAVAAPVAKTQAAPISAPAASAKPMAPTPAPAAAAKAAPSIAAPVAALVAKAQAAPISVPSGAAKPKTPTPGPVAAAKAAPSIAARVAALGAKGQAAPITAPAVAAKPKASAPAPGLKIPPILLEGDAPAAPPVSGPGQRYALGPKAQPLPASQTEVELPEAYGTQQLFLTARDPRWLYAHWDMTREQLKKHNSLSADGHLVLRIYRGALSGEPLSQIHVHPDSRNWFVPVPEAGAKYLADLGYRAAAGRWVSVALSGATLTPPDRLSDDTSVKFATIPPEVPFGELLAMVKAALRENLPLVEALQQMREAGFKNLPSAAQVKSEWTPAQEKALGEIVSMDEVRRVWIGSLEITELIRRQLQQQVSSAGARQFSLPSSARGVPSSVSSPFGGAARPRGFWFNVNAELIIYGATEPDATVTIGDRTIKLRPDGSFSFRFALPDGDYALPAAARSADGEETRRAALSFRRDTRYEGDVGTHPQDKNLKPPLVSAVS